MWWLNQLYWSSSHKLQGNNYFQNISEGYWWDNVRVEGILQRQLPHIHEKKTPPTKQTKNKTTNQKQQPTLLVFTNDNLLANDTPSTPSHENKQTQDGQAIYMFAKSRSRKKWPNFVASLMLVACLVVKIIHHWIFVVADPLWPCIKVKVIEASMSI